MNNSTRRKFLGQTLGLAAATIPTSLAYEHSVLAATDAEPAPTAMSKRGYEPGLASYSLHKLPLDTALAMTNRVGLKHICLNPIHFPVSSKPDEIAAIVEKVKSAGLDLYACGVVYMKKPSDVVQAFELAQAASLRVIVGVPVHELLPLVNEQAQKHNIRLAIHNHGPHDGNYPTPHVAYEKIKSLDSRIGLCMDIGYVALSGYDPSETAERFADRLFDVHMKDLDQTSAKGHGVELGRGVLDLPRFLRTLDKIRYAGIVSIECEKDPNDPLAGLAESAGYLRGVLAAV